MRMAIDTGGTFTDCVFVRDGKLQILKVPSQPSMPEEAIAAAVRQARKQFSSTQIFSDERGLDLICGTTPYTCSMPITSTRKRNGHFLKNPLTGY